jgi:3-hydroxyisobutyrate dehydrogenase-like beta-hydroxyacid dehydrogenase
MSHCTGFEKSRSPIICNLTPIKSSHNHQTLIKYQAQVFSILAESIWNEVLVMSELTLIGLGAMGTAIARTLIENGYDLTVWNRSTEKAKEIARLGASSTETLKQAIESSPRILFCIHGYEATRALLDDPDIISLLPGRTIMQMSTGTPAEARAAEAWINEQGGHYLDCSIMVYPESIGKTEGQLLVSGSQELYDNCTPYLKSLGGDIRYLGSSIGAAAALDLAAVTRLVVNTVGVVYGAHLCESEGLSLQHFADMYPEGDRAHSLAMTIDKAEFDENISATVGTSIEVVSAIQSLAVDLGINTELPDFVLGLYKRAAAAGWHKQDNASLIKVFRGAS